MLYLEGNIPEDPLMAEAEEAIRNGEYQQALDLLNRLSEQDPDNGRVYFNLGTVSLLCEKYDKAVDFCSDALSRGYDHYSVYVNRALAEVKNAQLKQAESDFQNALDKAEDGADKWMIYTNLCIVYLREKEYLKAEKYANKAVAEQPEEYQGYHLKFLLLSRRKAYDEVREMLDTVKETFSKEPQFLIDSLAVLEMQGKYTEELKLLENNENYEEIMPIDAIRKRIHLLLMRNRREETKPLLIKLYEEYGDLNAGFSYMVLHIINGDFIAAGRLGNEIMQTYIEEEMDLDQIFYQTMYLQAVVLKKIFEKDMPEEVQEQINEMANEYADWLKENKVSSPELSEQLEQVKILLNESGK